MRLGTERFLSAFLDTCTYLACQLFGTQLLGLLSLAFVLWWCRSLSPSHADKDEHEQVSEHSSKKAY